MTVYKKGNQYLEILHDEDPESPRDWDNLGTIVCWHPRHVLGDEKPKIRPEEYRAELKEDQTALPVYLMDHSGISMSTEPFG